MAELVTLSESVAINVVEEGHGPPVLFLHGVGASLESWDALLTELSPGRRYVRMDLRGHGRSMRTPGPYSLAAMAADVAGLLDRLGVDTVHLVGFSLGGLIAQAVALDYPDRVRSLALLSTVAGRTPEEQTRVLERERMLEKDGPLTHLANAVERWFTPEFIARNPDAIEARRKSAMQNDPACYLAAYRVLSRNDLGDRLHAIRTPTLVLTGENDVGSSARMSRFMHERIVGSELHILPGLKHSILTEAPGQVAAILEPFLLKAEEIGEISLHDA